MFIYKNQEELSKMTPQEIDVYAKELKAHEAELRKEELAEATKGLATKEELTSELEKTTKAIADLQETVNEIKDLQLTPKQFKTFNDALNSVLTEKKADLSKLKDGGNNIKFVVKTADDMTLATNIVDDAQIPQAQREAGITRIVRRQPFIIQLVNTGTINSNKWEWVQQVNPDGGAAMTAEGAAKSQADFDLELAEASVRKVTAYIKISKEMLDDVDAMRAEINQELTELINLKIDSEVLSGDGTGQHLTGILENATDYNAGAFAGTVVDPNNADVLRTAINQVMVNLFQPNYIVLHPSDVTALELAKGNDGHYAMPPFTSIDGTVIKGIPVVMNTGVTEGTFLVGDFTKSGVRFKEGLTINVGYENDDFTKNFVTILAEARLVHRVKSNHYGAFVKGVFADAIDDLEKVVSV